MATTKSKTKSEGYKGHNAGSRIGHLHECFDKHGEDGARKLGEKLQLADATLSIQFGKFRKTKKVKRTAGKKKTEAQVPTSDE